MVRQVNGSTCESLCKLFLVVLFSRMFLPGVSLFVWTSEVLAIEASGAVGTRVEYTDNVRNSSRNAESDVIQRVYGEFGLEEVRKRFKADANVKLENEHYYQGAYNDETSLTSGFGLFTIDLVEDFLEWQATFSRTDVVSDSAQDENPDTREFRNIFRTGPTINYALTRTTKFNLRSSYVKVDNSEESADDSERVTGSARLSHQLNTLTSFNVGGDYSEVIESDAEEEIENSTISGGFTRRYVDGALNASYGVQEVKSNIAPTEKGTFLDISLSREFWLAHTWLLKYNQSISDTSIGFEDDEEGNRLILDPTQSTNTTDIETRERVNLDMVRDTDTYSYDFGLVYEESSFKIQQFTERYRGISAGYSPKVYARLTPRVQYDYSRESFGLTRGLGVDVTQAITFSLKYQLIESFYTDGFLKFEDRKNDKVANREYDEFSIGIGLRWEFL